MSDDSTELVHGETNPVEQAVEEYDPVEFLSESQIHAVMKMVIFPKSTNAEVATAVGVTPRTVSTWKQDPHFTAYLNARKTDLVAGAIEASSRRRALIYDKLSEEVLTRFDAPVRDRTELAQILGDDFTEADRQTYEARFATNMTAEKLMRVWGQVDDKIVEEKNSAEVGMAQEQLVAQIRDRHVELRIVQRDITAFVKRTGFNFNVNYHDEDPETAFSTRADAEVVDAEFTELEPETSENMLDKYSLT